MNNISFEWDENKAKMNYSKHGVRFETAARVFGDASRLELLDEEHSFEEERYITIGSAGDIILILFVVYTERNYCIRIISARKATKEEREVYYLGKEND